MHFDRPLVGTCFLWRDPLAPSASSYGPPHLDPSAFLYDPTTAPGAKVT